MQSPLRGRARLVSGRAGFYAVLRKQLFEFGVRTLAGTRCIDPPIGGPPAQQPPSQPVQDLQVFSWSWLSPGKIRQQLKQPERFGEVSR